MGREKRIQIEGGIYHIISKGNMGRDVFIGSKDKQFFVKNLRTFSIDFNVNIFSYVLMDNHYHLLIKINSNNLSSFMHRLNTTYSHYFNYRHSLTGHLFHDRYKSFLVKDDKYFVTVMRYIALNPVIAKIVRKPEEYKWGSYRFLFQDNSSSWVKINEALLYVNMSIEDFISLVNVRKVDLIEFRGFEGEKKISAEIILKCIKLVEANIGKLSDNKVLRNSLIYYLRKSGAGRIDIGNSMSIAEKSIYFVHKKVALEIEKRNVLYINSVDRISDLLYNYLLVPGTNR